MSLTSSSGEGEATNKKKYILSRRIEVPPNYKALVSLESMVFIKPCLFSASYFDGSVYCAQLNQSYRIDSAARTAANAQFAVVADVRGQAVQGSYGALQGLLTLRTLLRNVTNDQNINFLRRDGTTVINALGNALEPYFYIVDDFRMYIITTTANRTYTMTGRIMALFGGVKDSISFSAAAPAYVRVSFNGHNVITVNTSLGEKNLTNLTGDERIVDSDITEIISTNVVSGTLVSYKQQHAGCKLSLADSNIDTFTIELRDEWGEPLPGVDRYICTLMIDFFPVGDAADNSVSLFDVRKRLRQGGYYSLK
jgi:hypothetical protein